MLPSANITRFFCFIIALCMMLGACGSYAFACEMPREMKSKLFSQFDIDRDKKLTQQEYVEGEKLRLEKLLEKDPESLKEHLKTLEERFITMDVLKRGWVDVNEFKPINLLLSCH